eukprot:c11894_g1_i1.p1 GENE.c11894_g1_i1~~c11894_g1_i1.p1  ORF type:complete len:722 (-),score=253.93 c11894_g1_i1:228-2264(-)
MAQVDEKRCVDTIRLFAADVVEKAKSGHPGAPMGCAPIAHVLWSKVMKYNPHNPSWINRDRFVLSNGHACALLYTMLHLTGYEDMTLDQVKQFRQLGSLTPGHPENHVTKGVEVSTGPLGQGISNAVGLAIAEEHTRHTFNAAGDEGQLFGHFTYVLCGDGCMQEGISSEASSLAGHLGLGRLVVLYDDNQITIDGDTSKSFTEDVLARYAAYGWHTQAVPDGNTNTAAIEQAIRNAQAVTDKPSLIAVRTTIGYGSEQQGTGEVHGSPLGSESLAHTKTLFGFDPAQSFHVDQNVKAYYEQAIANGQAAENEWNEKFQKYTAAHPEQAAEINRRLAGKLPEGWAAKLPRFTPADPAKATRQWSQQVLQAVSDGVPEVVGGSADLTPSNGTALKHFPPFTKENRKGRYFHFGVREHAMAAICNGLAAYGLNIVPFGATFLNFIEYGLGAVRVCAISNFRVIWIMTHDSIGLGEDGPTHQPVEVNALIRAMPNILFVRPGDGNETTGSYIVALENTHRSSVLALSRQAMPNLEGTSPEKVRLGGYALNDVPNPNIILVGTGSELMLVVEAAKELSKAGTSVRVVSMPIVELFEEQSFEYRRSLFPAGVAVVSVEAMSTHTWARISHAQIGVDSFGVSAPYKAIMEAYGLTTHHVIAKAQAVLAAFPNNTAPDLLALRAL